MEDKQKMNMLCDTAAKDYYIECGEAYDGSFRLDLASRLIDAHCHIYPDGIAARAVHAINRFYEGLPAEPCDGTVQTLLRVGEKQGLSGFVVHSVATSAHQVARINEFLAQSKAASDGRFIALGTLFPDSPDTDSDFANIQRLGLSGVKIHPDIQRFDADSPWAMHVYELCEEAGLPVLVHTGDYRYDYSNPPRVEKVLRAFPRLKFIGAHFAGWSVWDEAVRRLADYPNLTVDTSSSFYWLMPDHAREIIRAFGSERVMFGSDYPMWSRRPELEYLRRLDLNKEEYEDICWRTCTQLFKEEHIQCQTEIKNT